MRSQILYTPFFAKKGGLSAQKVGTILAAGDRFFDDFSTDFHFFLAAQPKSISGHLPARSRRHRQENNSRDKEQRITTIRL